MSRGVVLQCSGVSKSYALGAHRVEVLKGVSLSVEEGQSLAVMGSSGAGKSTLLHVLGGLEGADLGRVQIHGHDVDCLSRRRLASLRAHEIGFVFQAYHLLPELTILENVLLPSMAARGLGGGRERAEVLLERVGLVDRMDHKSRELSGGEQQRAAIARALMNRPSILLADEPTGNLDSRTGESVLEHLFDLLEPQDGEGAITLVMVTHNEQVAARCGGVVHLRDGVLVDECVD